MSVQARPSMTPVTFTNRDGLRLFGILHRPAVPRDGAETILILSPGVKMRVAPHRLYNKLADRFVALGHTVLRFDFHGLGDSEGGAPEAVLADFYGATQLGRYVDDTVAAMDWMQRDHGSRRFIAAGLCGGALTGLLTSARDPRIVALFGISMPVILDGSERDARQHMTAAQMEDTRWGYLRKLRPSEWHSWVRLLSFRSDYRMIARALLKPLRDRMERPQPVAGNAADPVPTDNTNPLFAPAFSQMVAASRPVLLVFGESDRLYWEFQEKFMQRHQSAIARYSKWYRVEVIPRANHIFSSTEWQEDLFARCVAWLQELAVATGGAAQPLADESAIGLEKARSVSRAR